MKARYPITLLLLVGTTSFITWLQSGNVTTEHILKSISNKTYEFTTEVSTTTEPKSSTSQLIDSDFLLTPPTKVIGGKSDPHNAGIPSATLTPVSELEKREYYDEFYKSAAYQSTDKLPKQNTGIFLLPVLFFDVGPNNLYRLFKETIPIANAMERTLVVPPFHRHPRMENFVRGKKMVREGQSGSSDRVIEVPIFDQTYMVSLETNPTKSLDMKTLRYLVPVESMERFTRSCAGEHTTLLVCGELDEKRRQGIELFKTATKLKFNKTVLVENLSDVTEDKTWKVNLAVAKKQLGDSRCAGIALGRGCLGSREAWLRQWKKISPFVRRPVQVKVNECKFDW